jgi:hypothetical protein
LWATLAAFFLAVGVAAHALDELHGRPLGTAIPTSALWAAALVGLSGAVVLGVAGVSRVGIALVPFIIVGPLLAIAYNAELFGGLIHTDVGFAASWGAFPVLVGYVAQADGLALAPLLAAGGAFALSLAQRSLSTPARQLRRRVRAVEGTVAFKDGSVRVLDVKGLLAPLEATLRALTWAVVALATALAVFRLS